MSFVRVGAFALTHVGMMTVVYVLAKNAGGFVELPVIFFGNILVMGLEGLIVGIQVLRLMFYELFSKFYTGGGKPYIPFKVE
jgi:V/A-type H+-transporting ATPase subunit I